eukprot:1860022-Pleurochrysis_carterae.AAC.1
MCGVARLGQVVQGLSRGRSRTRRGAQKEHTGGSHVRDLRERAVAREAKGRRGAWGFAAAKALINGTNGRGGVGGMERAKRAPHIYVVQLERNGKV